MDPISEMIACFRSWLPEVRVLGNVQAGPAADALESLRSECDRYREALEEIADPEKAWKARGIKWEAIEFGMSCPSTYREIANKSLNP